MSLVCILTGFAIGVKYHQGKECEKEKQQAVKDELNQKQECCIFSQLEHNQADDKRMRYEPVITTLSL